jgi:hypothetical protein
MELCSLHPFDEAVAHDFLRWVTSGALVGSGGSTGNRALARGAIESIETGREHGRFELTLALARELAEHHPTYFLGGISLTSWEARIDRGIGMLMRPPSRLMIDSGIEPAVARTLPIRLDLSRGMMGGAYIPARLVPDLERLLETRLQRTVRRLIEAEWDGVGILGFMMELTAYARANELAIFEAMDVVTPDGEALGISGARVISADRRRLDKELRKRLELAAKPPKNPGFWSRLRPKGGGANGHIDHSEVGQ